MVASYCLSVVLRGSADTASSVTRWLGIAAEVAASAVCFRAVVRTGFSRWEVILGAAAVTLHIVGDTYYFLSQNEKQLLTYASIVNTAYEVFHVLTLGVFVIMMRRLKSVT